MEPREGRAREIQSAIAKVLLEDWDPIGVAGIEEAKDEYDSYVGGVYRLLAEDATPEELAEHLASIEHEAMGLSFRAAGDLMVVAQRLRALDVRLGAPKETPMNPRLEKIVAFLNQEHRRATYGAVGEALGLPAQAVGGMLGPRCAEASWVVNADTREPSGYSTADKHAALHERSDVITTGLELLRRMVGLWESDDAR